VVPPEPEAAARDAIRHRSRLQELAEFAAHRHGLGVTYPGDLDEHDVVAACK
jgi:hypothetical protein